jgi:phosphomannomutase
MKNHKTQPHNFHPSILRAYDIRGILGETLSEDDAYYLGKSFGSFIADNKGKKKVCVGFDGRLSSPILEDKLVRGLLETGAEVIRIGLVPTPALYFSVQHFGADGGIMITGSHNPPSHNGFKMMFAKLPLHGEDILKLGVLAATGDFTQGSGAVSFEDVKPDYLSHLLNHFNGGDLKVSWDSGNGAAGEIMQRLTENLSGQHILLNEKIDGNFPSHHPDPSVLANMLQLIDSVKTNKCDIGIAFDGDGDRIGVVDNEGNMIFGDQLMMLFSEDVLKTSKGGTVIADVKTSQTLFDFVAKNGGKPLMWKTGHSLIKTKMFEEDAALAGEMSGHIFFKDNFGFDDGIFAAVKILNIVAALKTTLSEKIASLPKTFNTPEMRVHVDETRKFAIVEAIKQQAREQGANVNDIDGVRASIGDGWWLIRASNTEAALVCRCEATSQKGLDSLRENLLDLLKKQGVEIKTANH